MSNFELLNGALFRNLRSSDRFALSSLGFCLGFDFDINSSTCVLAFGAVQQQVHSVAQIYACFGYIISTFVTSYLVSDGISRYRNKMRDELKSPDSIDRVIPWSQRVCYSFIDGYHHCADSFWAILSDPKKAFNSLYASIRRVRPKFLSALCFPLLFSFNTFFATHVSYVFTAICVAPFVEEAYKMYFKCDDEFTWMEYLVTGPNPIRFVPALMHSTYIDRNWTYSRRVLFHMGWNLCASMTYLLFEFNPLTRIVSEYIATPNGPWIDVPGFAFSYTFPFYAFWLYCIWSYPGDKKTNIKKALATLVTLMTYRLTGTFVIPGTLTYNIYSIGLLLANIRDRTENHYYGQLIRTMLDVNVCEGYVVNYLGVNDIYVPQYKVTLFQDRDVQIDVSGVIHQTFLPKDAEVQVEWAYLDHEGRTVIDFEQTYTISARVWNKLMHSLHGNTMNPNAKEFVPRSDPMSLDYLPPIGGPSKFSQPELRVSNANELRSILAGMSTEAQVLSIREHFDLKLLPPYLVNREISGRIRSINTGSKYRDPGFYEEEYAEKEANFQKFIAISHGKHRKSQNLKISEKNYSTTPFVKSSKTNNNLIFRVPLLPGCNRYFPKPLIQEVIQRPFSVKQWLSSRAFAVLPKGKHPPYMFPCGNEAARLLFKTTSFTHYGVQDLEHLLHSASVEYIDVRSNKEILPAPLTLGDFVDWNKVGGKKFELAGPDFVVRDPESLQTFEKVFQRDKPIFRAALLYLKDGSLPPNFSEAKLKSDVFRVLSKVKTVKQGVFESIDDIGETVMTVVSEHFNKLIELSTSFGLLPFARLLSLLFGLYSASTTAEMVNLFFLYISGEECKGIPESILAAFKSEFTEFTVQGTGGVWDKILSSSIMQSIYEIVSCLSVWQLLNSVGPTDWKVIEYVRRFVAGIASKAKPRGSETLIGKVISFCQVAVERVCEFAKTRDWNSLLNDEDSLAVWKVKSRALTKFSANLIEEKGLGGASDKEFKRLREQGLIPTFWLMPFTEAAFEDELVYCITQSYTFRDLYKNDPAELRDITTIQAELLTYKAQTSCAHNVMANRVAPLGIGLYGPAGVGKSNLTSAIIKAIARAFGYPHSQEFIYSVQSNTNFQDGATTAQWAWIGDDLDQNPAPPQPGAENHVTWAIKIVNNAPFPIEGAAIELKGKLCGRPLLYMTTSNFPDGRLNGYTLYPPAFQRRFPLRIDVRVKPEFCVVGGNALDTARIEGSSTIEYWDLYISEYDDSLVNKHNMFTTLPYRPVKFDPETKKGLPMGISEGMKYIVKRFEKHLNQQRNLIARQQRGDGYCPECLIDVGAGQKCGCEKMVIENQGWLSWDVIWTAKKTIDVVSTISKGNYLPVIATFTMFFAVFSTRRIVKTLQTEYNAAIKSTVEAITSSETVTSVKSTINFVGNAAKITAGLTVLAAAFKLFRELYYKYTEKQGLIHNKTEKSQVVFTRLDQTYTTGIPKPATYTFDELVADTQRRVGKISNVQTKMRMHFFLVAHDAFIVPKHLGKIGETLSLKIGTFSCEVTLTEENTSLIGTRDLMLVRCSHLTSVSTSVMSKIMEDLDFAVKNFDECVLVGPDDVKTMERARRNVDIHGNHILSCDPNTIEGECGKVYLVRINSSWYVSAIHTQQVNIETMFSSTPFASAGEMISQLELRKYSARVQITLQGVAINPYEFAPTELPTFSHFPQKSEVWTAASQRGVVVNSIGMIAPKIMGATMKSKVHPTVFAKEFEDFEEKYCGRKDYWQIPKFDGFMQDGKWISWYVNSLVQLKRVQPSELHLMLAVLDYVKPFANCRNDGYRMLSDNETVVGITSSVVNPVNMNTSVGPPFSRKKRDFLKVVETDAVREASMDIRVKAMYDVYEQVLSDGHNLPVPIALSTKKDEPISYKKNDACAGRVFCVLPAAYNLACKKRSAPLKAYFRANWRLSECAVGINIASPEALDFVLLLDGVRVVEEDYTKMDKTTTGYMFHYSSIAVSGLSWLIGINWRQMRDLVTSMRHTVYVINNDFYQVGAENPSGNDITVEVNSINNSLAHRYVHFRRKFPIVPEVLANELRRIFSEVINDPSVLFSHNLNEYLDFRINYMLMTYGDDSLKGLFTSFASIDDEEKLFAELGYEITDGQKEKNLILRDMRECSFLKRTFYVRDGLLFAPLNVKTIVKMMRICLDSTLSRTDHGCCILSDIMKESFLHGEEFFKEVQTRVLKVIDEYKLEGNPFLRIGSYDSYLEQLRGGTFKPWTSDEDEVKLELV